MISGRFVALCLELALLAGTAAAEERPPPPPELLAFVSRDEYRNRAQEIAKQSGRWHIVNCSLPVTFSPGIVTWASQSMSFRQDGVPATGALWVERLTTTGCGQTVILNVGAQSLAKGIAMGPMAPGTTRTDPVVQMDAYRIVTPVIQAMVPKCDVPRNYIHDTIDDGPPPGGKPGEWE